MGSKEPVNDLTIIKLLNDGRIQVREVQGPVVWDWFNKRWMPLTRVYVRDMRYKKRIHWRPQTMHPNIAGHPYFSVYPNGRVDDRKDKGMVWLNARRVVWYASLPEEERIPTDRMICPIDGDSKNYNKWNLVDRDQNDENVETKLKVNNPEQYGVEFRDPTVPINQPAEQEPF